MITMYSTGCPKCKMAERLLQNKGIEYNVNTNNDDIMSVAHKHNINSVPFAEINGDIVDSSSLLKWINNN